MSKWNCINCRSYSTAECIFIQMFLKYPVIFCEIVVITPENWGLFFLSLSPSSNINKLFLNLDSITVRNINTHINDCDYVTVVYTLKRQATTSIIATTAATLAIQVRDRGLKKIMCQSRHLIRGASVFDGRHLGSSHERLQQLEHSQ